MSNMKEEMQKNCYVERLNDGSMRSYLKTISRYKKYSASEENELAKYAAEGDFEARRKLIQSNLRLVISVARRNIHKCNIPMSDLIQEGNLGLLYAIKKYKWQYGYKFSTYAAWWIRQFMFKAISEQSFCVKIPVYIQETISKYNKVKREMENEQSTPVSNNEIATKMKLPENKIDEYLNAYTQSLSIDAQYELINGSQVQISDILADETSQNIADCLENEDLKKDLQEILSTLKDREQSVIAWRFGLNDIQKRTLEEIGKHYGVTKECIRQTEMRAVRKMHDEAQKRQLLREYIS